MFVAGAFGVEMPGIVLFIYALLTYLAREQDGLIVVLEVPSDAPSQN